MDAARQIPRYVCATAAVLGLAALWAVISPAKAADTYSEDAVKAAYLYRIAGYVHWPDQTPPDARFTIAVLGSPGVARELRHLLPGHLIYNRPVQIREITGTADLGKPQILFVGTGRAESLREVIPSNGMRYTLLVTDEEGGLNAGSSLNFLTIDQRVRFEISLAAADRSGLKISAELLGVAVRVRGGAKQS
jgi:YfiR/HmsC-like